MSTLAVLGTLTVAVGLNSGSRMRCELVSPRRERVETGSGRSDANTFGNTMVKGKATLLAEVGKPAFALREPIIIKLTLRNESDSEIYIIETSPVRDNQLEIKNSAGEKMPLSEKAKKVLSPHSSRRSDGRYRPQRPKQKGEGRSRLDVVCPKGGPVETVPRSQGSLKTPSLNAAAQITELVNQLTRLARGRIVATLVAY